MYDTTNVISKRRTSTREEKQLRLLIGSRESILRSGCRHMLESQLSAVVVGECQSAEEVLTKYRRTKADAAIVDIELAGPDGIDAFRRLASSRWRPSILIFGAWDDPWRAMWALDAGALGFVSRHVDATTLADAVRSVARGKPYLSRELSEQVAFLRINRVNDPFADLSPREFEVFRLIASGRPLADVASILNLRPRSVANYQSTIKRKLNVTTTAEMVHLALRHRVINVKA